MNLGKGRTTRRLFLFGTLFGVFFAILLLPLFSKNIVFASTGINQQINFQGRLLDATGATAPDGFYNIQFKIYQDGDGQSVGDTTGSPAGTLKWTENYLNSASHGVKVQNGFMSVQLGSVNPFGGSIDWNQSSLWLSMNIGNTNVSCTPFSSCVPDGEMIPMQAMTSAVYALNAMQLGGLTAASFGQLSQNQTWTGYNTYKPTTDSATAFQLQNQSAGTAYVTGDSSNNQLVLGTASSLSGKLAFATIGGGTLTVVPTSSASSFTITLPAETGTVCTTAVTGVCSTAGTGFVQLGPTSVQADGTANNSIFVNKTNATGNILELQKSGSDVFTVGNTGNITATGTYNSNAFNSTTLTFGGANPVISPSTTNTGLTAQANGTGTLTLNTTGAGTVNVGTTNSTTVGIGNSASTTTVTGATNINTTGSTATSIGTGSNTGTIGIGNSTSGAITLQSGSTVGLTGTTTITGLTAGSAAALTVNNSTSTGSIFAAQDNGTAVFTIADNGGILAKNSTNSLTGFQIQPSGATTPIFNADTTNSRVGIGTAAPGGLLSLAGATSNTALLGAASGNTSNALLNFAPSADNIVRFGFRLDNTGNLQLDYRNSGTGNPNTALTVERGAGNVGIQTSGVPVAALSVGGTTGNFLVTSAGAVTAVGVTTSGATTNINDSSNFNTNINTTSSTGTVAIGNSASTTNILGATNINTSGSATTTIGNASAALAVNGAATFSASGTALTVTNDATSGRLAVNASAFGSVERFRVDTPTTADNLANASISTSATTSKALVLQGVASQTADLFQVQSSTGAVLARISAAGVIGSTDMSSASTPSADTTVRTGNATGSGGTSVTGNLNLKTGDSTNGASGAINIDSGNATGGLYGAINIGVTNSVATTIGNNGANTNTLLEGGSGASAIGILQSAGGTVTIGTNGTASNVQIVCGVVAGSGCGFAANATDHSTKVGSTSGTSATTIQGGSGGITLTGAVTTSSTINTDTLSATALTFSGVNPVISASTTNTNLTLQANGTGILALSSGTGSTINMGTGAEGFVNVGNVTAATQTTVKGGTGSSALALQVGSGGTIGIGANNNAIVNIGSGSTTAGNISIQGGAGSLFSVNNTTGTSVLKFAAPSTAGIVSFQLPNAGVGGTTYDICTTLTVCTGYASSNGANQQLSNLSGTVAINLSLLPGTTNNINVGSAALSYISGFFGTSVVSPSFQTLDQTAASTPSSAVSLRSGDASGTGSPSSTGAVTIKSGDSTNSSSGAITIDSGSAGTTKGAVNLGNTNASNVTVGNTNTTTTLIQGGSTLSLQTATSGSLNIGTTNSSSIFIGSSNNVNSITLGQSTLGESINIENTATAATTAVNILSGAGTAGIATLSLGNNTRVTSISMGNINPAAARTIAIGNTTGTANAFVDTINIATNPTTVAGGNTVHIADGTPTGSGTNLVTIGSTANASTTIIQGGTGSTAIQLTQATGGGIVIGNPNTASTVQIQCGAGTSSSCGFANNANDHTTTIGSNTVASATVIQSGTSGISLNGAVTTSSTINTDTLSATALTFSGVNPVISASTTNTGITLQSNGTGILALDSSGAGMVNVGLTNATTVQLGNTTAATQTTLSGGTGSSALGIQVGTGGTLAIGTSAAALINVGNITAATVTTINGGTNNTTGALNLQVGNGGIINIGTTSQTSVLNLGNTSGSSTNTLINGGTGGSAIQLLQGNNGTITIGATGGTSAVQVQCGASATACNFGTNATDHSTVVGSGTGTSLTTINGGSGGISLTANTSVAGNNNLTMASGTGQFLQTFTGTNTDANTITANSLTTGTAFKVNSTNNTGAAAGASWSGAQFNATNSQSTNAVAGYIYGADFEFTQNASVASTTESAVNIAIAATGNNPADSTVAAILNIANNDTSTGSQIVATDGIKITATTANNITNGIELSGTFGTNLITSTGFNLSNAGSATLGASGGSGALLVNNGATLNTASNLGNFNYSGSGNTGSIGTAAATVNVFTYFIIPQTTTGQTLTIPNPTSSTAGRIIYISNTGSTSFNMLSATINPGTSATLVWSGSVWTYAGADGSSILNQFSSAQTANFLINGTGQAGTSFLTPLLDTPTGTTTLNIGTTNATVGINLNQNTVIAAGKNLTVGATAGSGSVLFNNGATLNSVLALSNFNYTGSGNTGSIGSAASTVDIYTAISIAQTQSPTQALTIPAPTANTTYGRMLYLSNIGTASFTISSIRIPAGSTATMIWSHTNAGDSWQFAGAGASSIENQNAGDQAADFRISGSGQATTSFLTPLLDTPSGTTTLNIGTNNATVGISLNQNTTIGAGKTLTVGGSAGSGSVFTNNGATLNSTLALGDLAAGSIGANTATVDKYTSFSIAPTASGRTYTIPAPTANTNYGRMIYISNIAAAGNFFKIGTAAINPGATASLVWSNTNGGDSWQFAGADAGNLQGSYNNSIGGSTPEIKLDTTRTSLDIQDADTALNGSLLTVRNSNSGGLGSAIFDVQSSNPISDITNNSNNNLVTNGSFETGTTGWLKMGSTQAAVAQDNTAPYIGSNSLKVLTTANASDGAKYSLTTSTLVSNTKYSFTIAARMLPGTSMATFEMGYNLGTGGDVSCLTAQTVSSAGWTNLSCTFTVGTTTGTPYVYVKQTDATVRTFYIDTASLTRVSLLSNASVEQAISGSDWANKSTATVSRVTTQFQDGAAALKIVTVTNALGGTQHNETLNDSTQYNLSFWALLDTGSTALTTMEAGYSSDGTNDNTTCITGQTVTQTGTNTGWTNYTCSFTTPSSHSGTPYIYIKGNVATARTFYIDNVQLTQGNPIGAYREGAISLNGVITSPVALQGQTNSTAAFQIQNASGSSLFTADTTNTTITFTAGTVNTTLALGDLAAGSIGTAPTTVDIYTSISIAPTASNRAYTIPNPTAATAYGRMVYVSNIASGANYFTISGIRIPPGSTGTLIWSNTSGGASWQFAGAGGASIENQNSADQTATFRINGSGTINNSGTTAFQVQNGSAAAVFTVNTSGLIIQVGSSASNNGTTILALNSNDGTTTPTEVDGGMYFNNSTSQFMCGENGFWVSCGVPPRDHSYDQYDEFMNGMGNDGIPTSVCTSPCAILPNNTVGIGALNWYNSLIGSGQTTQKYLYNQTGGNTPTADVNRPGILDIQQTGTGNNSGQTMSLGVASMKLGTSLIDLKTAVNITGGNLTTLIGIHNETTATTAPTTGAYFKQAGNGTWNYCYVNGTPTETCTTTCSGTGGTIAATAGTWYRLEIVVFSSTEIDFYVNGNKCALTSITYNTTNKVAPAFTTYKTSGTPGTLDMYVDYFQLLGTTTTGR